MTLYDKLSSGVKQKRVRLDSDINACCFASMILEIVAMYFLAYELTSQMENISDLHDMRLLLLKTTTKVLALLTNYIMALGKS
jgi:hypothetical protein